MDITNSSANLPLNNQDGANVYNQVKETPSGHLTEMDDTVGNERMRWEHTKGTYEEWDANGGRTVVVRGDNFEAVVGNNNIVVTGQCNITVNGACGILCTEDLTANAKSIHLTAQESINLKAGTSINMESVAGDFAVNSGGGYVLAVEGEASERFKSSLDTNVNANNDLTVGEDSKVMVGGNSTQFAEGGTNIATGKGMVIGSGTFTAVSGGTSLDFATSGSTIFNGADLTIESGPVSIVEALDTDSTITSVGVIHSNADVTASSISLTGHRHGSSPLPS